MITRPPVPPSCFISETIEGILAHTCIVVVYMRSLPWAEENPDLSCPLSLLPPPPTPVLPGCTLPLAQYIVPHGTATTTAHTDGTPKVEKMCYALRQSGNKQPEGNIEDNRQQQAFNSKLSGGGGVFKVDGLRDGQITRLFPVSLWSTLHSSVVPRTQRRMVKLRGFSPQDTPQLKFR